MRLTGNYSPVLLNNIRSRCTTIRLAEARTALGTVVQAEEVSPPVDQVLASPVKETVVRGPATTHWLTAN